jgi:site-specific DNA recombinase
VSPLTLWVRWRSTLPILRTFDTLTEQDGIHPDKVAIYIRWSTDDQAHGTTLEVQDEACKHYILSQGWRVNPALIFVDDGYSGASLERPAMTDLRKAVQAGRVDCAVIFKLDRLSRSVLDTVTLVLQEWKGKCHVKSSRELIDTTTPQGRMIFYVLVSFAEHERDMIRDRLMSGKIRRAQQGRNPGRALPWGFRKGEASGQVVAVAERAAIVRRVYEEYLAGKGIRSICRELNQEGGYGTIWEVKKVQVMLDCPLYKGELTWGVRACVKEQGKTKVTCRAKPTVSGVPFVVINLDGSPAAPIVPPDLWQQVWQARRKRATPGVNTRAATSPYLLTGLAKCRCGYALISVRRRGTTYLYRCSRRHVGQSCECMDINQSDLDDALLGFLRGRLPQSDVRATILSQGEADVARQRGEAGLALRLAADSLKAAEHQASRISADYRVGLITAEEYQGLKRDLERERHGHRRAIERAQGLLDELELSTRSRAERAAWLDRVDAWESLDRPEQKRLLKEFVRSLRVFRSRAGGLEVDLELVGMDAPTG